MKNTDLEILHKRIFSIIGYTENRNAFQNSTEIIEFINQHININNEYINLKVFSETKGEYCTLNDLLKSNSIKNLANTDFKIVEKLLENNLLYKILYELKSEKRQY